MGARPSRPSLADIWEWYWRNGSGTLTLMASLSTALILIFILKKDLDTAFTVASWILVAGTMLAVTVKGWLWERPGRHEAIPLANHTSGQAHLSETVIR